VRFLLDLAIHGSDRAVSLKDSSERQGVSEKYLWQVVTPLRSAGVIESVRGAHGGYRLMISPSRITIARVLELLEGATAQPSVADAAGKDRDNAQVTQAMWRALDNAWTKAAAGVTLDHLAEQYRHRKRHAELMYEI
jgi:Rrf2 family transcriptional regulator, cysteine metabolism repressor